MRENFTFTMSIFRAMSLFRGLGLAILVLLLSTVCVANSQQQPPHRLDPVAVRAVLSAAMRCQNLPQLHATVVYRDAQLHSFRLQLQPDGSVTDIADTSVLLPLASVSKGMFSTVLPIVQQQLRDDKSDPNFNLLTTPIKQLLGDNNFWFLDHTRTEAVTIEDLTSHTTGLSRHDALSLWSGIKTKAELAQRTGRFSATGTFRGSYIYNNLVWTIADTTVERLTGQNFTTYMRRFLWQRLGMTGTVGSSEIDSRNLVSKLLRVPKSFGSSWSAFERTELERSLDIVEAAGGIYAPLDDMVKYMRHHTSANYSSFLPPPAPFKSVNGFSAAPIIDLRLINDSVTNFPDVDSESYGHGWHRQWYRNHLSYEHGGSLFNAHCHLRVLSKLRLSVFLHVTLGPALTPVQSAYANLLSNYLTDLLLQNSSFATQDNVCNIFKAANPGPPQVVPRRSFSTADTEICTGSFGSYGFGQVQIAENSTSGLFTASYGSVMYEMTPVRLAGETDADFSFFLTILRPRGFPVPPPVLSLNASHVTLRPGSLDAGLYLPQTPLFMRISRTSSGGQQSAPAVYLRSPAFESAAQLEKGLKPADWKLPQLCPTVDKAATATATSWTAALTAVMLSSMALRA